MGKGRIRLISTVPGYHNVAPIIRDFCKKGGGILTAFSDAALPSLAELAPADAGHDVVQLGAVARRFATVCGEMPPPIAHRGHAVAAIGAACAALAENSPFARTAHRIGLHKAIAATLHELAEYGLSPEDYGTIAEQVDDDLGAKLRDLAEIETAASDSLRQLNRTFGRDLFERCLESKPEPGVELGRMLVLGAGDFHPQAARMIKWAASHGAKITVIAYRHATGEPLFPLAARLSDELKVEPEIVGTCTPLQQHLFASTTASQGGTSASIVSAADPLAEVEWALRGCLERHQGGLAYERMAIYVRDHGDYAPLIESASKRLGVPVRSARRAALLSNSFARLTLAALEGCASEDVRRLLPVARSSYVGLTFEERTELETALKEAHSSREKQWQTLGAWVSERSNFAWLAHILAWRSQSVRTALPAEGWVGEVGKLQQCLPVPENLAGWSERDARAQNVLKRSLTEVASVRRLHGRGSMILREFTRHAREIWVEADVSLPSDPTGVRILSSAHAMPEIHTLFVLGMLEGVFPRRRSEDPILSDLDRAAISSRMGSPRLLNSRDKADQERDEFYLLCGAPSDEVVFSYPQTDEERDNVPAFYLNDVVRALDTVERIERPRHLLTPDADACLSPSDREIAMALADVDRTEPSPNSLQSPDAVHVLRRTESDPVTPRELKEAFECPFSHFAHRRLRLRPQRLRARWYSLVRLPTSGDLLEAQDTESARRLLQARLAEQLDAMYSDVPEWEISLLRAGGERVIDEWVDREFESRDRWPKALGSLRTQVRFGDPDLRGTLKGIATLEGTVPAMSRTKDGLYSVVHLTETSAPQREGGELRDPDKLYYGLYLLASYKSETKGALEIETLTGERMLMLLPRLPNAAVQGSVQHGLMLIDLAPEGPNPVRTFLEEVKELARQAMKRIVDLNVQPTPGTHCERCDYGELCRQSMQYGEEVSPFVEED